MLRTCDCLGIQHVWLVGGPGGATEAAAPESGAAVSSADAGAAAGPTADDAARWLSVRRFQSSAECVEALRREPREIWATDLAQSAERLDVLLRRCVSARGSGSRRGAAADEGEGEGEAPGLPARVALVFGSEAEGVSKEMLLAADRRIYLPLQGTR